MCKCRLCWCWYINCCHSFVGCGNFCGCCGYNFFNPLTNLIEPSCSISCCACFCCKWIGYGEIGLCCSSVYGSNPDFDNSDADRLLTELGQKLKQQRQQENAVAAAAQAVQTQMSRAPTSSVFSAGSY